MLCFRIYLPHPFAYLKRALSWLARVSGGDGGELNSPSESCHIPRLLVQLLNKLTTMGETATQMKKAFEGLSPL